MPVPLVHAVTAPAAVRLVLPHVPAEQHAITVAALWQANVAMLVAFTVDRRGEDTVMTTAIESDPPPLDELIARAIEHGDDNVIKSTEACAREQALRPDPRSRARRPTTLPPPEARLVTTSHLRMFSAPAAVPRRRSLCSGIGEMGGLVLLQKGASIGLTGRTVVHIHHLSGRIAPLRNLVGVFLRGQARPVVQEVLPLAGSRLGHVSTYVITPGGLKKGPAPGWHLAARPTQPRGEQLCSRTDVGFEGLTAFIPHQVNLGSVTAG